MAPTVSKRIVRSPLSSQVKEILCTLNGYFKEMNDKDMSSVTTSAQLVATSTGIPLSTVHKVLLEGKRVLEDGSEFKSPKKKRCRKRTIVIDDFDKAVIRRTIRNFHITDKEFPTMKRLHEKLKTEINYPGSIWSLRKEVKDLGFKWRRTEDNRNIMLCDTAPDGVQIKQEPGECGQHDHSAGEGRPATRTDWATNKPVEQCPQMLNDQASTQMFKPHGSCEVLVTANEVKIEFEEISLSEEHIKEEPASPEGTDCTEEHIKEEPASPEGPDCTEELYAGHEVKEEMVIGPVVLQNTIIFAPAIDTDDPEVQPGLCQSKSDAMCNMNEQSTVKSSKYESNNILKIYNIHTKTFIQYQFTQIDQQFSCDICKRQFSHKRYLIQHLPIHSDVKPFSCDVCNKQFRIKSRLTRHQVVHSSEKPFTCDICDKQFTRKSHFTQHQLGHTRPFACDVCDKRFRCKSLLAQHLVVHTGAKTFSCDICNKKFGRKSLLPAHQLIHTGEKPYPCDVCNKQFRCKSNLARHQLGRTKSLSCDICNKQFRCTTVFTQHQFLHSGGTPFSCDVCKKQYRHKSHFTRHMRYSHKQHE